MKRRAFYCVLLVLSILAINVYADTVTKKEIAVHFTDIDRKGLYSGEINENSKPEGFGIFEAVNANGQKYIAVGDWVDGHLTGDAWMLWENGDIDMGYFEDGHFVHGKYARDVNLKEYNEKPKFPDGEGKLITYEELLKYGELFDQESAAKRKPGKVPVQLEMLTTEVTREENGIKIKAWIKGEKGYYFYQPGLSLGNEKTGDDENVSDALQSNQRITVMVTPYADGSFYSNQIGSVSILENEIDLKGINFAEFKTYEELSQMNVENPEFFGDKEIGVMEMIIGEPIFDEYWQVWIKGKDGYVKTRMTLKDFSAEKGQRWYVVVEPYDGHVYQMLFKYTLLVEENVNLKPIEEAHLESEKQLLAEDPIKRHLLELFDSNKYNEISYKKILRNPAEYTETAIRIEGKYKQEIDNAYIDRKRGLMVDREGNYYHLYMMKEPVNVVEFNLLEDDEIVVYGYLENDLYEYTSWTGNKKVPSIFVIHVELLEEHSR